MIQMAGIGCCKLAVEQLLPKALKMLPGNSLPQTFFAEEVRCISPRCGAFTKTGRTERMLPNSLTDP